MGWALRLIAKWSTGLAAFLLVTGSVTTTIEDGARAFSGGDCEKALKTWRLKAEQGNPEAQFRLGKLFLGSDCGGRNLGDGLDWIELSAGQGYPLAEAELGARYLLGDGYDQDLETGLYWLDEASGDDGGLPIDLGDTGQPGTAGGGTGTGNDGNGSGSGGDSGGNIDTGDAGGSGTGGESGDGGSTGTNPCGDYGHLGDRPRQIVPVVLLTLPPVADTEL